MRTANDPGAASGALTERELYIGLMSGTSLDGVDGVLVEFGPDDDPVPGDGASGGPGARGLRILAHRHLPFSADESRDLLALQLAGPDELHRAAVAGNRLADRYADAVADVLDAAGIDAAQVRAVGAHGQTVRHQPRLQAGAGYTLQIGNAAGLAESCGIDVIADFRARDVAAGGLGAPLVPAFHAAVFGRPDASTAVLNLGGIANVTLLPRGGPTTGFDCGPGNLLMDGWCGRWLGTRYDADGAWAATGRCLPALLAAMQAEPYFALPPPKATGRELFNSGWLDALQPSNGAAPEDVQATLAELTAWAADAAIRSALPDVCRVLVCGGGAYNGHLLRRLQAQLAAWSAALVTTTATAGIAPDRVEATAFAWLARQHVLRRSGNLPAVTGASGTRVLGALYPA